MEFGINEGAENFDADNFFIQAQRLKEGLEVKPFPRWAMDEDAEVPVESVDIDHAMLADLDWRGGFEHGKKEFASEGLCAMLNLTTRNCEGVIRKGCPTFFALIRAEHVFGGGHGLITHWSPARRWK